MTEETQFDLFQGRRLRDEGMSVAAANRMTTLEEARIVAEQLAASKGDITIDDVNEVIEARGMHLGPAAGSVFRSEKWVPVGYRQTTKKTSHARPVRVWRFVREA